MNSYGIQIEVPEGRVKEILDKLTAAQNTIYECYSELEELGNVHVVGVFSMAKAEGEELAQGAAVYYDSTAEAITATADGNTPAGYAASPAAATAATVMVKLLG